MSLPGDRSAPAVQRKAEITQDHTTCTRSHRRGEAVHRAKHKMASLFGDEEEEEEEEAVQANSVLRYERPKAPGHGQERATAAQPRAQAAAAPPAGAQPQFVFAGQVAGLYKLNAQTRGFEPTGGAGPFGVVLVGG